MTCTKFRDKFCKCIRSDKVDSPEIVDLKSKRTTLDEKIERRPKVPITVIPI